MTRPRVLMVTGAYEPEISGAGKQCRELVRALHGQAQMTILTTAVDSSLPTAGAIDGVPLYRIRVDVTRWVSKLQAAVRLSVLFIRLQGRFDIVHLHGFSQKSLLLVVLAKLFRKKLVLKLTSVGHDDPLSIRRRGNVAFRCYAQADLFIGVSPRFEALYRASGLPRDKFSLIPNGVALERFRPRNSSEQRTLRQELGLPVDLTLILFVGFFSHEKCPDVLFEAWVRTQQDGFPATGLLFVGATHSPYYEIDARLTDDIREQAKRLAIEQRLIFVEQTHEIEKYYGAADLFVLPSIREGLPNALLEAMASGLPCIASKLTGVTDTMIEDGVNGLLIPPGDRGALERALQRLVQEPKCAQDMGRRARQTVEERYTMRRTASRCLEAYQQLVR